IRPAAHTTWTASPCSRRAGNRSDVLSVPYKNFRFGRELVAAFLLRQGFGLRDPFFPLDATTKREKLVKFLHVPLGPVRDLLEAIDAMGIELLRENGANSADHFEIVDFGGGGVIDHSEGFVKPCSIRSVIFPGCFRLGLLFELGRHFSLRGHRLALPASPGPGSFLRGAALIRKDDGEMAGALEDGTGRTAGAGLEPLESGAFTDHRALHEKAVDGKLEIVLGIGESRFHR